MMKRDTKLTGGRLRYGNIYEFALNDNTTVIGTACDSGVIVGSLFGKERRDVCWSKVVGFRNYI
jgi:hypothetical protein